MNKSEQIDELATALAKAQSQFEPVVKTGLNPHLKNRYVTLDGIIEAIKVPLSENGIAYTQLVGASHDEHGGHKATLTTMLLHSSGQWISTTTVIDGMAGHRGVNEMQAFGSSLTYMKRYALAAILGISGDEDDDGNASSATAKRTTATQRPDKTNGAVMMEKLRARWDELLSDAQQFGVEVEALPDNIGRDELIERGKALAETIETAKRARSPAVAWPAQTVAAVLAANLSTNMYSVTNALKYAALTRKADAETVVDWFRQYRAARDSDASVGDAAVIANAWLAGKGDDLTEPMTASADSRDAAGI